MAGPGPLQHAADALEPTLALVLKETGKFFRATQSNDSRHLGIAKTTISQAIPAANLRLHDALDDLEAEIVRAKSVFERDLSTARTKRAERQRAAAGTLKTRSPGGVVKSTAPKGSPKVVPSAAPEPEKKELTEEPPPTASDDLKEEPETADPEPVGVTKPVPVNTDVITETVNTEPFSIPNSLSQDPNEPKGLAISLDQTPSASAPADPPKTEPEFSGAAIHASSRIDAIPQNFSSADFESMFEDPELPGANDEIDFDLAFPSDNANESTGLLDPSAFANLPLGDNENTGNPNLGSVDEDLTTLLPGLENYVNDGNEFQLPDMTGSKLFNSNTNDDGLKPDDSSIMDQGHGNRPDMPSFDAPMPASHFEDMFGVDSYMNGTGDDELGGTGDFDEDWFRTDGMHS
ncbi:hypothetical protein XPA_000007 [Xanthoria parietina]